MSNAPKPNFRKGPGPGELQLTLEDGAVLIVHAHGVHDDELRRTRERVMKVLGGVFPIVESN